jgi:cell division protein FtsL
MRTSLGNAILLICVSAWILGSILLAATAYLVPQDIQTLRQQLRERAEHERRMQSQAGEAYPEPAADSSPQ